MTATIRPGVSRKGTLAVTFASAVTAVSLTFVLAACSPQSGTNAVPDIQGPAGIVLATVGGQPITEQDVRMKLKAGYHDEIQPEPMKGALDDLILEEMKSRRAMELGLDKDPAYRKKIAEATGQLNHLKREEMAKLFHQDQVVAKSVISDEEARKYFEENKSRIQTELHVWQILSKDDGQVEKMLERIKGGASFLDVARERFQNLPKTMTPWELGYLHWNQIPEAWQAEVYGLNNGDVSGVLKGPRGRAWIIKVIDKRTRPDINFESEQKALKSYLTEKKRNELAGKSLEELRTNAKVVYPNK